jgi:hypothetical protein
MKEITQNLGRANAAQTREKVTIGDHSALAAGCCLISQQTLLV